MSLPVTFVPEETRSHRRGRLAIECLAELAVILRLGPPPVPVAEFGAIRHAPVPVRVATGLKTAPESKRERRLRLISHRALRQGIGMSSSGGTKGAQRILTLITGLAEKGVDSGNLTAQISNPVVVSTGGLPVFGAEATVLTDLCEFILQARDKRQAEPLRFRDIHSDTYIS